MKCKTRKNGFSLIETMMALAVVAVMGMEIYIIMRAGTIMFQKNTAINVTNQQVKYAVERLEQDMHASISNPQLVDVNGNVVSGNGPAAGVSFRQYAGGPFSISSAGANLPSTTTQITIKCSTLVFTPRAGQRVHIQALPTNMVERDISAATAGSNPTLTLASSLGTVVPLVGLKMATLSIPCFISTPVSYIVKNGQMIRTAMLANGTTVSSVIVPSVQTSPSPLSATPFTTTTIGSSNPGFVTLNNFTASDPGSSNRGYTGATISITVQPNHYGQLTSFY